MTTTTVGLPFELKSVEGRTITGYAAAWAKDRVGDIISKTAFDRTLKENPDISVFVGHDASRLPVGEPVEMRADDHGLFTATKIYATADGDALLTVARERLSKGKTLGMSIGFRSRRDRYDASQKARILEDLDLIEFSFLASPQLAANPQAVATGVKATDPVIDEARDFFAQLAVDFPPPEIEQARADFARLDNEVWMQDIDAAIRDATETEDVRRENALNALRQRAFS